MAAEGIKLKAEEGEEEEEEEEEEEVLNSIITHTFRHQQGRSR